MLKNLVSKVCQRYNAGRPRVVVGVPSGITEVEERAVEESIIRAGAKEVFLIEEPMAAAIGAGLDVAEPIGNIIADIGGGTTEVAVISLGGIVVSNSLRTAGDELDEDIVNYIKREMGILIGTTTAEEIKIRNRFSNATYDGVKYGDKRQRFKYRLSKEYNSNFITNTESNGKLNIRNYRCKTPPELAADIVEKGVVIAGGGALIRNIDKAISQKIEMPVYVAEDPLECVVKGTGKTLADLEKLKDVLINARKRK